VEWARIRSRTDHEGTSGSAAMAVPRLATTGSRKDQQQRRRPDLLLVGGIVGFTLSLGAYVLIKYVVRQANESPGDLEVYRQAGLVVRHAAHWYDPTLSSPLYDWPKYQLPFTYTPFAALVFTVLTLSALHVAANLWIAASLVALVVALWATFGGLGYRAGARLGGALLIAAVMLWIEPVLQALSLGQIELMLMALVIWDMCQPDRRWWKGAGIGIAAGIKLAPLIFIPYLLLTRRFRAAAVAAGTFVATVVLGYFVLPADSRQFWLGGVFMQSGRPGFPGEMQNQALGGLITRLAGSVAAGHWIWLPVAVIIGLLGLAIATVLHRAGRLDWLVGLADNLGPPLGLDRSGCRGPCSLWQQGLRRSQVDLPGQCGGDCGRVRCVAARRSAARRGQSLGPAPAIRRVLRVHFCAALHHYRDLSPTGRSGLVCGVPLARPGACRRESLCPGWPDDVRSACRSRASRHA